MTSAPTNIAETSDSPEPAPSPAPGQRKRGAELEQAIRSACVAELADQGFGSLTIESIASRAQTGKASIYRRWSTKEELVLDSVSCLMIGPVLRLFSNDWDDSVTTRDALRTVLLQVAAVMGGPDGDAMRSVMSESLRSPSFSLSFECDFFDPRKQAVLNLLRRGVERGEVRPDAVDDIVVVVESIWAFHQVLPEWAMPS